jgi:hypothetical protein
MALHRNRDRLTRRIAFLGRGCRVHVVPLARCRLGHVDRG